MIELGLSRVHHLLARTRLPWRAIHVAGTNGKGSICAYVTAMLETYNASTLPASSGHTPLRHGRFTSPHLIDRWDCITINGKTVSAELFRSVESSVLQRDAAEKIGASEFEILTATAFEIFTQEQVDVGVVEVGMGGRLDATNVIGQTSEFDRSNELGLGSTTFRPSPLMTAVTSIALDHQAFLGNTIEEIACEKAGIFKPNVPAVIADDDSAVTEVLRAKAASAGSSQFISVSCKTTALDIWRQTASPATLGDTPSVDLDHRPIQAQWSNGAIALRLAWQSLHALGRLERVSHSEALEVFKRLARIPEQTVWPGRLQHINIQVLTGYDAPVILDGAHNAQSAAQLTRHVRSQDDQRSVQWVLAASAGKDIGTMLDLLLKPGDAVVVAEFGPVDGMPWVRPMSCAAILEAVDARLPPERTCQSASVLEALQEAGRLASINNRRLVIAGSLYLIGDVCRLLREHSGQ